MSDFIFSAKQQAAVRLGSALRGIYPANQIPKVFEFSGPWGCVAVSASPYAGFDPIETADHVCVVVGGPVLAFTDNRFLVERPSTAGTRATLAKFIDGGLDWSNDLSGPFVVLILDKRSRTFQITTDLMSSIPVYATSVNNLLVGTHVSAIDDAAESWGSEDPVSTIDFLLNGYITYRHRNIDLQKTGTFAHSYDERSALHG